MKTVLNVFGIIGASILSIFLIISLVVTPVVSSVSNFFKGETIKDIISDLDFYEIVTSEVEFNVDGEAQTKMVEEIMNSEMMGEVIELFVDGLLDVMEGKSGKTVVSSDKVLMVAKKHKGEINSIVKKYLFNENTSDEEVDVVVSELMDELANSFTEMLPTAEDLGLDKQTITVISGLRNGTYVKTAIIVTAIITALVMLCQVMRFKGFMWISVDYYIAAVVIFAAGILVKSFDLSNMMGTDIITVSFLSAIAGMISGELIKGAIITLVLGVVFTVIFVVGRKALKKKNMNQPVGMM